MHCSANEGLDSKTTVFFGLSEQAGDVVERPFRRLIGDDEHGWGPDGIFNFEEGATPRPLT